LIIKDPRNSSNQVNPLVSSGSGGWFPGGLNMDNQNNNMQNPFPWMTKESQSVNVLKNSNTSVNASLSHSPCKRNESYLDKQDRLLSEDFTNRLIIEPGEELKEIETFRPEVKSFNFDGHELFKYMIVGGSIMVIRYSLIYLIEHPNRLSELVKYEDFDRLPIQVQILIVFVVITFIFFMCKCGYNMVSNNRSSNHVFNLIKESLVNDANIEISDDDIVTFYSTELKLGQEYFRSSILPEVKRLAYQDGTLSITKYKYQNNQDQESEIDVWKCFQ
jgi:hypothetical protein